MSKILDLLNYYKKGGEDKKGEGDTFSNNLPQERFDSNTKEKLANTYIFNPIEKIDKVEDAAKKQDKKISLPKHDTGASRTKFVQFFPWLITFLAVLLLLINIVYRGKINVIIEFVKESPTQTSSDIPKKFPLQEELVPEIKSTDATQISIALIGEGGFNRYIIKRLGFYGAALSRSKLIREGFFLYNDGTTGWASVGLDLAEPMDLSNSTLDFFIKGLYGEESLRLFLRDAENNSYLPQADNIIFSKNMTKDWQFMSIPFNNFNGNYNPRRINHIGFEFGTQTTLNAPGTSIYVKNIRIVKNPVAQYEKTARGIKQ